MELLKLGVVYSIPLAVAVLVWALSRRDERRRRP